ncbi:OFA family MFS transporter [Candidatus Xianfuyuplasma coldseepsis]|uniref:OFA family MFS transporter n=1 Tax=Candidatus Xianfuyuplasma coldseepsis TaxID=2782163 RepID=A0A7L7KSU5_9MOLU|nr:OFA family MFS transporter [Xianfuyuplasma coldseepsis]QMS85777.1 OFA family MFS transporter [Xianfuyuplasma coldseepsis]
MKKMIYGYVMLGTTMMLLLGIVYSYSLFRVEIETVYAVNKVTSGFPFMMVLLFYALFMAIGGKLFQKYNTLHIAIIGSLLISTGFLLSGVANSILVIIISYGVLIGSGIGLLYGLPLRIVSQLQHPKPGLLTGITLMGFGLSPLIFAPIVRQLLSSQGLSGTFIILGIVYGVLLFILSFVLSKNDQAEKHVQKVSYYILRSKSFYIIFSVFLIATFIGLSIIGLTANIGEEVLSIDPTVISIYLGVFAIFNGIGRPLFGYVNDRFGFKLSGMISFSTLIVGLLLLFFFVDSLVVFILAFIIIYVNFGGWLSLAPSATIQLFGKDDYSQNYGVMFLAYGLGAFIGTLISGYIIDYFTLTTVFLVMAILAFVGLLIIQTTSIESKKRA